MRWAGAVLLVVAAVALASCGGSDDAPASDDRGLLVALGGSVAVGTQYVPVKGSAPSRLGYPRQVAARPGPGLAPLEVVDLACGLAAVSSIVDGPAICGPEGPRPYGEGSPLRYAERLLRERGADVRVVTVDLGFEDLLPCDGPSVDRACAERAVDAVVRGADEVGRRVRAAAHEDAALVLVPPFDPFVTKWPAGARGRTAARIWARLVDRLTDELAAVGARHGFRVADVRTAFGMRGSLARADATFDGRRVPGRVARACELTFACPNATRSRDLRRRGYAAGSELPNRSGQAALAEAVRRALTSPAT